MLTEKSVEHGDLPTVIHLFRRGIVSLAGGWEQPNADDEVYEEVRVTLLHEIGHHFGLEEEDLEELGYE
jgi:predicted Zn-dependent protease with MMP-like domain